MRNGMPTRRFYWHWWCQDTWFPLTITYNNALIILWKTMSHPTHSANVFEKNKLLRALLRYVIVSLFLVLSVEYMSCDQKYPTLLDKRRSLHIVRRVTMMLITRCCSLFFVDMVTCLIRTPASSQVFNFVCMALSWHNTPRQHMIKSEWRKS